MGKSRGRSRPSKLGKGVKGGKAAKGAKKPKKVKPLPKKKAPAEPESGIPAVCSECFGDYLISTKTRKDKITCPACGHVGLVEEDTFAEVSRKRHAHKQSFIIALAVNGLAFLFILLYGLLNSWPFAVEKSAGSYVVQPGDETVNMALLGLGILLLLGGFFVIARYEKSRVEVYF